MKPLAERVRPQYLSEVIGQKHLIGEKGIISKLLETGNIPSLIFWGPPGVGKTTLANLLAQELKRPIYQLSAVNSGVKEVRQTIETAKKSQFFDKPQPILFIDEIHRFSKSQQDSLLHAVEKGIITLIGATTENPSFEVISALLSRCQVYILHSLEEEDLLILARRVLKQDFELKNKNITLSETESIIKYAGGDARKLLNIIEIVTSYLKEGEKITNSLVESLLQKNILMYDKGADQHYDMASAFIKSIRGSDPDAAIYWLGRMVEGGEDVKFIARRLIISAAEDIGLANPNALLMANTCFQSVHVIGMPEARIILAEATIYLATSPKSNSAYKAIGASLQEIQKSGPLPVPLHLRNAPTKLMKDLKYGQGYQYPHDHRDQFVKQQYLPEKISKIKFYHPGNNPTEDRIKKIMNQKWKDE